jgi:hypothetical protein
MKVIKDFITQSVTTPPPLKRNLIPRFMKGRGYTRNDEGCIDDVTRRTTRQLKGGRLLGAIGDDILKFKSQGRHFPIWVRTFKVKRSLVRWKMIFSWID